MKCKYCRKQCIKKGIRNCIQKYQCKYCKKHQQATYKKHRIKQWKYNSVSKLSNENIGISSIGRLLKISKTSVLRLLKKAKSKKNKPKFNEQNQSYEIDELRTYCGSKEKEVWIIYAINRRTKKIINFFVGCRTKENIKKVVDTILELDSKHIYSDKLKIYQTLISKEIHKIYPHCTNHIERMNLTLRTQLKPLNRKTIGFTRSVEMLNCKFHLWAWK